jgi:hypothetical protein
MNNSYLIIDALIQKYCPDKLSILIKHLENKEIYEQTVFSQNPFTTKDFMNTTYLQQIHYSWWIDPLKQWEEDVHYFLEVLPENVKQNLQKFITSKKTVRKIHEPLNTFLQQTLLDSLQSIALPIPYLPKSIMTPLLYLSKKQLITLVDYLALYDLSYELKHIVDTNIIKPIFSYLDKRETIFLKKIMKNREPFSFSRMELDGWDKEEKTLRANLHKKGIFRLSIAISSQSEDFVWHIVHRLDKGRGTMLKKNSNKEVATSIIDAIQANVIELLEDNL